jgi:hypothetical protein
LERDESDDSFARSDKVSWCSEKIDFCEENVGNNNDCSEDTMFFKRLRNASSEIQKAKKVKEEVLFSFDGSNFQ